MLSLGVPDVPVLCFLICVFHGDAAMETQKKPFQKSILGKICRAMLTLNRDFIIHALNIIYVNFMVVPMTASQTSTSVKGHQYQSNLKQLQR